MPSYRPRSATVTTTNNGSITDASSTKLSNWNRTLVFGVVRDSLSVALTNAAVNILRLASASGASTDLGVVFTNTLGEYGVSLPTLTAPERYRFDYYSPVS